MYMYVYACICQCMYIFDVCSLNDRVAWPCFRIASCSFRLHPTVVNAYLTSVQLSMLAGTDASISSLR